MCVLMFIFVFASLVPWTSNSPTVQAAERRGCRAGYFLDLNSDLCAPCPSGTFTESYNWDTNCQPCSPCNGGRQIVAACSASSDTLCRCPDDHYEHEDGCSLKTDDIRSQINELHWILLSIQNRIDNVDKQGQENTDILRKTIGNLSEIVASSKEVELLMQEDHEKMENLSKTMQNLTGTCGTIGGGCQTETTNSELRTISVVIEFLFGTFGVICYASGIYYFLKSSKFTDNLRSCFQRRCCQGNVMAREKDPHNEGPME